MDEINNLAIKIKLIMKWNTKYKICFNNVNQFNNFFLGFYKTFYFLYKQLSSVELNIQIIEHKKLCKIFIIIPISM